MAGLLCLELAAAVGTGQDEFCEYVQSMNIKKDKAGVLYHPGSLENRYK